MILTKKVMIKVNVNNIKNLEKNGYITNLNDVIEIDVEHLSVGSHVKIEVKCDVCGKERGNLMYKEYLTNLKSGGYYSCQGKCSSDKNKKTCLEKYGVEYVTQSEIFKNKSRETMIFLYGTDNYSKTNQFKRNFKKIMLEKYGVQNPSEVEEFKIKRKETMLEKYGVEYYVLSDGFKEKSETTSLKNRGVEHPMMLKSEVEKRLIKKGLSFRSDDFLRYRSMVDNLTKKNKKELFEKWDGYDAYDGEYIKDNLNLKGQHGDYPTIDHIVSVYFGFKNGIDPIQISNLDNLCITKRKINSSKNKSVGWIFKTDNE